MEIKAVVVGDKDIGKTCFLITFTTGKFPKDYIPTVFDNYSANMKISNSLTVDFQLWDTVGSNDYKKLRPLAYSNIDVFILCFSLVSPESYRNIEINWIPEIQEHCPNTPFILVGLKSDLRDSYPKIPKKYKKEVVRPISTSEGEALKEKIGARYYIECSSLENYHTQSVFESVADVVLHPVDKQISQNQNGASYTSIEYIRIQQYHS